MINTAKEDVKAVRMVLSQPRYLGIGIILSILFLALYTILTDIVIFGTFEMNPLAKPLDMVLILIMALLAALAFTLGIFQWKQARTDHSSIPKAGLAGGFLGFFATACPICQPIWLVWLGFGSVFVFLTEISLFVELASIALLLIAIHGAAQGINHCKRRI